MQAPCIFLFAQEGTSPPSQPSASAPGGSQDCSKIALPKAQTPKIYDITVFGAFGGAVLELLGGIITQPSPNHLWWLWWWRRPFSGWWLMESWAGSQAGLSHYLLHFFASRLWHRQCNRQWSRQWSREVSVFKWSLSTCKVPWAWWLRSTCKLWDLLSSEIYFCRDLFFLRSTFREGFQHLGVRSTFSEIYFLWDLLSGKGVYFV